MQQPEIAQITTTRIPAFVLPGVTLSIVVPVMNEQQNVRPLYEKVSAKARPAWLAL